MKEKKKNNPNQRVSLSPIPNKLYFSIGEVSELCDLKPHILRYWENEFIQLSPTKRRGNRRYYQHKEVVLIRRIRELLYEKGFTIDGARQQLLENSESIKCEAISVKKNLIDETIAQLEQVIKDLESNSPIQMHLLLTTEIE